MIKKLRTLLLSAIILALLFASVSAQAADYIAAEHTKSNGCPYYIMVNRKCNTVTIYALGSDGCYSVPCKAMICSTGREGHSTPLGTYSLTSYKRLWNPMVDGSYGQYISQFKGNFLFHSVCYSSENKDDLITEEYNMLGDFASAGCVRLQVADAKWIYDNCAAGTKVTIYDGDEPGALGKPQRYVDSLDETLSPGWEPTDPDPANPWRSAVAVTALASRSGEAEGAGPFLLGSTVNLKAMETSAEFLGWYDTEGSLLSEDASYSFTANASTKVYAIYSGDEFVDIPDGAWYADAAVQASRLGFFSGRAPFIFAPDENLTRAETAALISAFDAENGSLLKEQNVSFDDVSSGSWYFSAVSKVSSLFDNNGAEGLFRPEEEISRQELVSVLMNYLALADAPLTLQSEPDFTDSGDISPKCIKAVTSAHDAGLIPYSHIRMFFSRLRCNL